MVDVLNDVYDDDYVNDYVNNYDIDVNEMILMDY